MHVRPHCPSQSSHSFHGPCHKHSKLKATLYEARKNFKLLRKHQLASFNDALSTTVDEHL
eukprot:4579148-Amphidinium_carterae.1